MTIVQNKKTGYTYYTKRNKKGEKADQKLKLRKYDPIARAHAWFEEIKGAKPKKKAKVSDTQAKKNTKTSDTKNSSKASTKDKKDQK